MQMRIRLGMNGSNHRIPKIFNLKHLRLRVFVFVLMLLLLLLPPEFQPRNQLRDGELHTCSCTVAASTSPVPALFQEPCWNQITTPAAQAVTDGCTFYGVT